MSLTTSIRAAVMAAVLASAGFGQSQTSNNRELGMTPTDPRALQRMDRTGQPGAVKEAIPRYGDEVPNRSPLTGNTPETNSTLQETGVDGDTGFELGWLGLLGLAGLFGLGRGSTDMRRAPGNELHERDLDTRT